MWKDVIKKSISARKYYFEGFLDKVKQEDLEQELIDVEQRYEKIGKIYGRNWWIVEIIEDGMLDNHSVKKIIQTIHSYIDSDEDENMRLSLDVEREINTMPSARGLTTEERENLKQRLIQERKNRR